MEERTQNIKENKFDTIFYLDVIEHIEDDRFELDTAYNLLKKNGKLTTFQRVKCRKNSFKIFSQQDSSMQNILSKSNGFIIRSAYAKQINKNQNTKILTFKKIVESYI